jgi:hypothetical protein
VWTRTRGQATRSKSLNHTGFEPPAGTTGQALPPKRQANRGPRKLVGLARQGTSSRRTQRCQNSKHYGPQNALDSVLAWGDILTLTATEIVSHSCTRYPRTSCISRRGAAAALGAVIMAKHRRWGPRGRYIQYGIWGDLRVHPLKNGRRPKFGRRVEITTYATYCQTRASLK